MTVAAARCFASVYTSICLRFIAVIAGLFAFLHKPITTTRRYAGRWTGIGIHGVAIITNLDIGLDMTVAAARR